MSGDDKRQAVVRAYLDDAETDLQAARALIAADNRLAVYHLQQAAEKLIRGVRLHRGLVNTKDHELAILVDGQLGEPTRLPLPLSEGDPWRERMLPLDWLSRYATAFRYPSPSGRVNPGPPKDELATTATKLERLVELARVELLARRAT